ncbi:MAG: hypothetical protein AB1817_05290, partial [Chloroflexota bacterium]
VLVYTRYFPGWIATIDDRRVEPEPYGEQGLILLRVPAGAHIVQLRFEDTPIRLIGAAISVASLCVACFVSLLAKSKRFAIIGSEIRR